MRNIALLGLALLMSVPVVASEAFRFSLYGDDDGVETLLAQHIDSRSHGCANLQDASLTDLARQVTPQGVEPRACQ